MFSFNMLLITVVLVVGNIALSQMIGNGNGADSRMLYINKSKIMQMDIEIWPTQPLKSISEDMDIIVRCNRTSPISKRTLNLALIEKRLEQPPGNNFKCFLHCLYQNYEWMDGSGEFRIADMRRGMAESTLPEAGIDYLIRTCAKPGVVGRCQKALDFTLCFWEANEKLEQLSSGELQWINT